MPITGNLEWFKFAGLFFYTPLCLLIDILNIDHFI